MIPQRVGSFYIKPPRPMRFKANENPFEHMVFGDEEAYKLASYFGYEISSYAAAIWLYVPKFVEPHRDARGLCLLYLHRGEGTLGVVDRGKVVTHWMRSGTVVLFNDRQNHFWLSDKPCTLLACNIKKRKGVQHETS